MIHLTFVLLSLSGHCYDHQFWGLLMPLPYVIQSISRYDVWQYDRRKNNGYLPGSRTLAKIGFEFCVASNEELKTET